ncbi:MAG TPA: glycosyltransferase family 1 protein, partial [Methylomirabilota bacterium]|nr:glycosyltransferase family 1 protein [Methylomirabilota bacterium]
WAIENFGYRQPQRWLKTAYRELVWAPVLAGRQLLRHRVDLYHSTGGPLFIPPVGIRYVATLHDLAGARHPERFRRWHRLTSGRRYARIQRAERVICISRFTADEAMALLGIPSSRIEVVHNGCDFSVNAERVPEAVPSFAVPAEFFLFVGSLEPGKNLALLKAAYELAEARGVTLPPLFIVGARWEGVAGEGKPPQGWHYLGRQPDEVLVYLYRRALALVFPSKYEGFGLPVVEAMAFGCPVICSRVASLPEVAGKAALFADLEPAAYLKAMREMCDVSRREEYRLQGLARAGEFTWEACARGTVAVYEGVMGM